jgi:hypothetical protein
MSLVEKILLVVAVAAAVVAMLASIGAWPDIKNIEAHLRKIDSYLKKGAEKADQRPEPRVIFTDRPRCATCSQVIEPGEPPVQVSTIIEMFQGKRVPVTLNICQPCLRRPQPVPEVSHAPSDDSADV